MDGGHTMKGTASCTRHKGIGDGEYPFKCCPMPNFAEPNAGHKGGPQISA